MKYFMHCLAIVGCVSGSTLVIAEEGCHDCLTQEEVEIILKALVPGKNYKGMIRGKYYYGVVGFNGAPIGSHYKLGLSNEIPHSSHAGKKTYLCRYIAEDTGHFIDILHDEVSSLREMAGSVVKRQVIPSLGNNPEKVERLRETLPHELHEEVGLPQPASNPPQGNRMDNVD